MELSRPEYPALLTTLNPSLAVTVLNDRVRLINRINADIADWLSERRKVEEAYVVGLRRLASRRQDGQAALGVFQTPWQSVVSSMDTLAKAHSLLAMRIEADVERPLREHSTKSLEMQGLSTIQGNLAAMAKEVDEAQRKTDKLRSKGSKDAGKTSSAESDLQVAAQQWDSQAPYVFEQLQALDESRVNHLRDALTQLQTHEVDVLVQARVAAEDALNTILNISTADEISTFVARSQGAHYPPTLHGTRPESRAAPSTPTPLARTTSQNVSHATPNARATPRIAEDTRSEISAASGGGSKAMPPPKSARKGGISGLKRLGTVMTRRKTESKANERGPSPEKTSKSSRNPLRRGSSSRNMQQLSSANNSADDVSTPVRGSLAEGHDSLDHGLRGKRHSISEGDGTFKDWQPSTDFSATNGSRPHPEGNEDRKPRPPSTIPEEFERDREGFSVPSSKTDDISKALAEAANGGDDESAGFKLDIRTEPIREEDNEAQTALSNVANTLRAQAQNLPPQRRISTARGRRDVRNTIFVPNPMLPDLSTSVESVKTPVSPQTLSRAVTAGSEDGRGGDGQSIRSSHSLGSIAQTAARHPDLHGPGLKASIIETVSAWFGGGQVTKAVVIGELALAYSGLEDSTTTHPTASIRLENFAVLEKVAPNPSFLSAIPTKSGEYTIDTAQIARSSLAFKYQVHLEESTMGAYAPLLLTPSWKIEPQQASVIINYRPNPAFLGAGTAVLHNVVIMVTVEGARAVSCQSKPAGHFARERSLVYWKLDEVRLEAGGMPSRLLARFATESEGRAGGVEARWEVAGAAASGSGSGLGLSVLPSTSTKEEGLDPFADESHGAGGVGYQPVAVMRKLVSGKYVAT